MKGINKWGVIVLGIILVGVGIWLLMRAQTLSLYDPTSQTGIVNSESQKVTNEKEKNTEALGISSLLFDQDNISINIDLSKIKIQPAFNLAIGPVLEKKLSPNKKFLYFTTAQGGGSASFMYDIQSKIVYYLGNNIRGTGEWNAAGLLEVVNKEEFEENSGVTLSTYQSVNATTPWKMVAVR